MRNRSIKTFCSAVRRISESALHKLDHDLTVKFGEPGTKPKGPAAFWHVPVVIQHDVREAYAVVLLETSIMPTLSEVQGDGDGGGTGGHRWTYNFALKLIEQGIDAYMRSSVYEARMKNHVSEVLRRLAREEAA
jgi:hypothetical protein